MSKSSTYASAKHNGRSATAEGTMTFEGSATHAGLWRIYAIVLGLVLLAPIVLGGISPGGRQTQVAQVKAQ